MQPSVTKPRILACSLAVLLASTLMLTAEPKTWTGAVNGSWTSAGNWSPGALLSGFVDGLVYDATSTGNLTQTLGQNWGVTNLVVADVSGPITINAGGTLILSNHSAMKGRLDMSAAAADLSIYANFIISNTGPPMLIGQGRTLTLSNVFSSVVGGVRGPGTIRVLGSSMGWMNLTNSLNLVLDGGSATNGPSLPFIRMTAGAGETVLILLTNNGRITLNSSNTRFYLGGLGGTGTNIVRVESGTLQINSSGGTGGNVIQLGDYNLACTSILDINGGTVNLAHQSKNDDTLESYLDLQNDATSTGIANLNGGRVNAARIKATAWGCGTFNFNGGTLGANWNAGDSWFGGVGHAYVQAGGAVVDTAGFNVAIVQDLEAGSPSGGLTKNGAGTLTLAGFCGYTGPTLVNAGILAFSNNYATGNITITNPTVTVADGAGLGVSLYGLGISSWLTLTNVTLGSTGTASLNFNYGTVGSTPGYPALDIAGSFNLNATNIFVNVAGTGLTVGRIPLLHYSGTPLPSLDKFTLGSLPLGMVAHLVNNTADHTIDLDITTAVPVEYLTWYGNNNSDWDFSTFNWNYGANFYQETSGFGDVVTFDDTAYTGTVNLTTTLRPHSITVNNSTVAYTFSGPGKLSGTAAVTKLNSGVLLIATSNDYSGGTSISAGTVKLGSDSGLGLGAVTLAGGKICSDGTAPRTLPSPLVFAMQQPTLGDTVNNGPLTLNGLLDINSPSAWRSLTTSSDVIIAGGSTNGALQKQGPAKLVFLNSTNYWGTQNALIFAGTIAMTNAYLSTPSGLRPECSTASAVSRMIVGPGSTWDNTAGAGSFRVSGGNPSGKTTATNIVDVLGIVQCSNPTNTTGGDMLFDKDRHTFVNLYAGGLIKVRSVKPQNGTYNTNYHEFNFDGGTLSATPNSANVAIFMQGLNGACYIRGGGATVDSAGVNITIAQPLLDGGGNGALTKIGAGALTLTGANTYAGPTVVSQGALVVNPNHSAAGALTVAAGATLGFLSDVAGGTARVSSATVNGRLSVAFANQTALPTAVAGDVSTLTLNGPVDVVSLPAGVTAGDTVPLIHYGSLSGTITTGTLPAGMGGTVVNDTANHLLKLVTTALTPPRIGGCGISGGNFTLSGSGGPTGGGHSYYILSSTNAGAPLNAWVPVATNLFNSDGTFSASLPIAPSEPQRYYLLQLP